MKALAVLALTIILFPFITDSLQGCTIFKATQEGLTLVGNNEDWKDPDTKVWFLVPEAGIYGRVCFGFKNGYTQGGMNDQGLFYDWVAGYPSDYREDPEKKTFVGNLAEHILGKASTVEEALAFYSVYNERAFANARIFLADRTGASAVVGFDKNGVMIDQEQGGTQVLGYGLKTATKKLREPGAVSVEAFSGILKGSMQFFANPTQYSNVYDLKNRVVYLYNFRRTQEIIRFDLREELAKGNHYYDIPEIDTQLDQPLQVDGKTLPAVTVDPGILKRYTGTYRISPEQSFTVTVKNGVLYGQVKGMTPKQYRPASETKFFLTFCDQQITFLLDEEDDVTALKFSGFGGEDICEKVDESMN